MPMKLIYYDADADEALIWEALDYFESLHYVDFFDADLQSWRWFYFVELHLRFIFGGTEYWVSSKLRIYLQSCDIIFGETEGFASHTTEPRKDLPRTTEGFASNHRLFWFAFEPLIFFSRSFRKRGIFQVGGTGGCWVAFDFYLQSYRRFTGVGLSCCNWVLSWELSSICQSSIGKCRNR